MFGEIFYNRLPEFYRTYDKDALDPYQLQNFLKILGTGFDEFYDYTQDIGNNFDTDNADSSVLSASIRMLGFKFPYAMTDTEKKELIKILPVMYENKGNARVFEYLARLIFGNATTIDVHRETTNTSCLTNTGYLLTDSFYLSGVTTKNIILNVTFEEDLDNFNLRLTKFRLFVEEFRPVNTRLIFDFDITHTEEAIFTIDDERLDEVIRVVSEFLTCSFNDETFNSITENKTEIVLFNNVDEKFDNITRIDLENASFILVDEFFDKITEITSENASLVLNEGILTNINDTNSENTLFNSLGDESSKLTSNLCSLTSNFILTYESLINTVSSFMDSEYLIDNSCMLDTGQPNLE